ncbi:ethanolamine-phosphate cytidylyltransferase [Babesia microti strain RI]|uniref:ethanolamine-phosphate cytidylyltransferase n=1 Tax=Babesia microti (strain RI) TaxID=1133968 RepID=A0A1R4AAT0_BABMR|nr:ethanolamine-phosphate cytidylyltransferase [Babesia microti strain RI]SJK86108.1 ethanolamine-phosphate cytidylyltransferase [Babesia microti strain RI]|eukprot:XP_021338304.1 ethanolamine-phosphate cytidylyltransferase [Babesia microti strain RI]
MWEEFPATVRTINSIHSLLVMVNEFIIRKDGKKVVDFALQQLPENIECVMQGQKLYSRLIDFTNTLSREKDTMQITTADSTTINDQISKLSLKKQPQMRTVRVFIDGVFDLLHSGHLNALRQAKRLGHILVVGVNSDDEVEKAKGMRPIYNENERVQLLKGCKWVDEVLIGTPYTVTPKFLDEVANCDFATHGDDIALSNSGVDVYKECREAKRLKIFKRTRGVSSSTTLKRLLDSIKMGRFNILNGESEPHKCINVNEESLRFPKYYLSSARLLKFMKDGNDGCILCDGDELYSSSFERFGDKKVVYIDGCFDIFHLGHLRAIEVAKSMGNYLIVGLYDDETVKSIKGEPFPFTNLLERALTLLAMKNVDEVILGAPYIITKRFLKGLQVDIVASGHSSDEHLYHRSPDPYAIPRQMGILNYFDSGSNWTTMDIIERVAERSFYICDNVEKRVLKEKMFYQDKDMGPFDIQEN